MAKGWLLLHTLVDPRSCCHLVICGPVAGTSRLSFVLLLLVENRGLSPDQHAQHAHIFWPARILCLHILILSALSARSIPESFVAGPLVDCQRTWRAQRVVCVRVLAWRMLRRVLVHLCLL